MALLLAYGSWFTNPYRTAKDNAFHLFWLRLSEAKPRQELCVLARYLQTTDRKGIVRKVGELLTSAIYNPPPPKHSAQRKTATLPTARELLTFYGIANLTV